MARKWTLLKGKPNHDFLDIMEKALETENIDLKSENKVTVGNGTHKVVFLGEGFADTGVDGAPDIGTIETIKVVHNGKLVAKATGYALEVDDLDTAFESLANGDFTGFMTQFFTASPPQGSPRITINGSDDRDVFSVPPHQSLVRYTFDGKDGNDSFEGSGGNDKILGGKGRDLLDGDQDGDSIKGNKGNDTILGQAGDDALTGGSGKDKFVFDTDLGSGFSQAGVDTITDFTPGTDKVKLDGTVFAAIGTKLNKSEFLKGGSAQDGNDHILYKQGAGKLFYDGDGDGAGSKTVFARFDGQPDLSPTDFDIL
ncbi:MAG: calcium-binding protein [Hyphomicrobiales bacterium]|nr:calcium-binding protein [Hyphomicrobiales bacterium]